MGNNWRINHLRQKGSVDTMSRPSLFSQSAQRNIVQKEASFAGLNSGVTRAQKPGNTTRSAAQQMMTQAPQRWGGSEPSSQAKCAVSTRGMRTDESRLANVIRRRAERAGVAVR